MSEWREVRKTAGRSQGMLVALEAGNGKNMYSAHEPPEPLPEETRPSWHVDFNSLRPVLDS